MALTGWPQHPQRLLRRRRQPEAPCGDNGGSGGVSHSQQFSGGGGGSVASGGAYGCGGGGGCYGCISPAPSSHALRGDLGLSLGLGQAPCVSSPRTTSRRGLPPPGTPCIASNRCPAWWVTPGATQQPGTREDRRGLPGAWPCCSCSRLRVGVQWGRLPGCCWCGGSGSCGRGPRHGRLHLPYHIHQQQYQRGRLGEEHWEVVVEGGGALARHGHGCSGAAGRRREEGWG